MKVIGRRELATGLPAAAIATMYTRSALATTPIGMISVATVADVASVAPTNGTTIYVQGRTSTDDGFQGLFVAMSSAGHIIDGALVLAGPTGWVWVRQINNSTYLSSWWPVDASGTAACEVALAQFVGALPNNSVGVLCAGSYALGTAAGWTPLSLANRTNVKLIGEGTAALIALATPAQTLPAFIDSMMFLSACTTCEVSNIHFSAAQHAPSGTSALAAIACSECTFERLDGAGFTGNATFAEVACNASTWSRCRAHDSATTTSTRGFWLGNTAPLNSYPNGAVSTDLRVYKCEAVNNSATGIVLGALRAACEGCVSSNNLGSGIISPAATGFVTGYHVISGNRCEGNSFFGYQTDSVSSSAAYYVRDTVVSGNIFQSNRSGGMLINDALTFSVANNICANNSSLTATAGGIQITGNSADVSLVGNVCVSDSGDTPQSFGVEIIASPSQALTRISLANNLCKGNTTGIFATVVDASASIATLTLVGNIAENNVNGLFLVNAGSFTGLSVTGNACRNNSSLDIRCTVTGAKLRANTYSLAPFFASNVPYPVFANDTAAGAGGLHQGEEYVTSAGALFAKQ